MPQLTSSRRAPASKIPTGCQIAQAGSQTRACGRFPLTPIQVTALQEQSAPGQPPAKGSWQPPVGLPARGLGATQAPPQPPPVPPQDKSDALSTEELREELALQALGGQRELFLLPTSATWASLSTATSVLHLRSLLVSLLSQS